MMRLLAVYYQQVVQLIALEGLAGVQGQQLHRLYAPQEFRQGADTAPDALRVLALANGGGMFLLVLTVLYAFLSIRTEGASIHGPGRPPLTARTDYPG